MSEVTLPAKTWWRTSEDRSEIEAPSDEVIRSMAMGLIDAHIYMHPSDPWTNTDDLMALLAGYVGLPWGDRVVQATTELLVLAMKLFREFVDSLGDCGDSEKPREILFRTRHDGLCYFELGNGDE